MSELVKKLKVLKNPRRKSARDLLKDINKPNYECEIENKDGVTIKIFKNGVPMSLNDKIRRLLFVCSSNIDRIPAAVEMFKDSDRYETKSCGILPHAETVISKEALAWADIVFCMEEVHKLYIQKNFPDINKKIIVLNVSNDYMRNDEGLVRELKGKLKDFF